MQKLLLTAGVFSILSCVNVTIEDFEVQKIKWYGDSSKCYYYSTLGYGGVTVVVEDTLGAYSIGDTITFRKKKLQ